MEKEELEIQYIVRTIIEDAEEIKSSEEAEKALEAYRVIGQIIKDRLIGDFEGTRQAREFMLCRGKLKIGVIYDGRH